MMSWVRQDMARRTTCMTIASLNSRIQPVDGMAYPVMVGIGTSQNEAYRPESQMWQAPRATEYGRQCLGWSNLFVGRRVKP